MKSGQSDSEDCLDGALSKQIPHWWVRAVENATSSQILLLLIGFRLLNSLVTKTFFQPDEYFQSLEPAWRIAFGEGSGAWLTWEWEHHLRSALHPALFAAVYSLASLVSSSLGLPPSYHANLMITAPKVVQSICAALGDYYTWKLAGRIYGKRSRISQLALTVCSAWQWFCSTRTLSNCVEATLTVAALCFWPFQWGSNPIDRRASTEANPVKLRTCLSLAAIACVLRPTNLLVWGSLSMFITFQAKRQEVLQLFRDATLCGSCVLGLSAFADRLFYQTWTFPPARFLYFNIAQSLAIFYGKNRWDYYLTEGIPLLLTVALPFFLWSMYAALLRGAVGISGALTIPANAARHQLLSMVLFVIAALSLVSHKEVRFIYPLLPVLHLLAAEGVLDFLRHSEASRRRYRIVNIPRWKKSVLRLLLGINIVIAIYTTRWHQAGVISVIDIIRERYETLNMRAHVSDTRLTVGFLMPCHSTPWRSHLVHASIHAWALGCPPPINMSAHERLNYTDEADRFYVDPVDFIRSEHVHLTSPSRLRPPLPPSSRSMWPDCLVFFDQLAEKMPDIVKAMESTAGMPFSNGGISVWRGFNSHFHDDWRRQGGVNVWCFKIPQSAR